jgi:trans-aconitate methyltransferase
MKRRPEPELMLGADQARAYAEADFEAPHRRVVELFREAFPGFAPRGEVLDLGCGPGDIAMRFARAFPRCRVLGVDGSAAMLARGHAALKRQPSLAARVRLVEGMVQDWAPHRRHAVVVSNSLLHHLHDPMTLWSCVRRCAMPGARVFIVDLMRPPSAAAARALTRRHAAGEPDVLRRDFHASLLAAFTPKEVRAQLRAAGLQGFTVRPVSDRHLMVWGTIGNAQHSTSNAQRSSETIRIER